MSLTRYRKKRDFRRTPEPRGKSGSRRGGRSYVIHKHAARRLHHDLRLEHGGVLWSWAVPKGPPLEPGGRVLAVRTEDHPLEYGSFEGVIPEGGYGAGTVMLWDRGRWEPEPAGDPARALAAGKLSFRLEGARLSGRWSLVRKALTGRGRGEEWLLIKRRDEKRSHVSRGPERSVASGRLMEEIARDADRRWSSRGEERSPGRADRRSLARAASGLPGARRRAFPARLQPQLATLVTEAPAGDDWIHEIKHDGYRLLAFKEGKRVRLRSRRGQDWSASFPTIAAAVGELPVQSAVLDGETVVLRPDGRSDFQALQSSLDGRGSHAHVFFAFDLLYCEGSDLSAVPLLERKGLLARVLAVEGTARTRIARPAAAGRRGNASVLRYGDHLVGHGPEFLRQACRLGLEGIVSKRVSAPYEPRRSRSWLKIKCSRRQEFVIGGWSAPAGSRTHFGALLIGVHDRAGRLVYAGKVGTGFSGRSLESLAEELAPLETDRPPFANPPRGAGARGVHWTRPELVAEVAFTEWTADGIVRHPSFQGLRRDKSAREVRREEPGNDGAADGTRRQRSADRGALVEKAVRVAGVRITHPERVLYPEQGLTKRELAEYCAAVSEWMLPHLVDRPLTLVRCPEGRAGGCFYQKHATEGLPEAVRSVRVEEQGGGTGLYVAIEDLEGLVSLVQFGVLELHPWGSRRDRLERPDRIVIDLDPDPVVPWKEVVVTARALRGLLRELGLQGFARTTGGKGLHVVLPIERRSTWPEAKRFARELVTVLARRAPELYVLTASKARRKGRIFLDYLRNDRGSTAIASYSMRARAGAPVATPIRWDELTTRLAPERFTVRSVPRRLAELRAADDPWAGFLTLRQTLTGAVFEALRGRGRG